MLSQLIELLDERPSRLVIDYTGGPDLSETQLNHRFELVDTAISKAWKAKPRRYTLTTSVRSRRFVGTEGIPCDRATPPRESFEVLYSKSTLSPESER